MADAELSISADKAFFIVEKLRQYDEKVATANPDDASHPSDDRSVEVLEDSPDDPTLQELASAVFALNEDEKTDLVALMWVGRGDFSADEWSEARTQARQRRDTPVWRYLAGTPLASDYLEEGLSAFGRSVAEAKVGDRI